jgi:hypothetical protein
MKLECKPLLFLSELDELSFFDRIKQIKCVKLICGREGIFLHLKSKKVSNVCLRELLSIFYRYNIEMTQLSVFLNENNKDWFLIKTAYWYKRTFKNL